MDTQGTLFWLPKVANLAHPYDLGDLPHLWPITVITFYRERMYFELEDGTIGVVTLSEDD